MTPVGVQRQVADADDGIEVYLAVDVGIDFSRAAGLDLHLGLEPYYVHVEDYETGRAGVEALHDAEGLRLVPGAVDEPFFGQAGGLVLADSLRGGPGVGCSDVVYDGQGFAPQMA